MSDKRSPNGWHSPRSAYDTALPGPGFRGIVRFGIAAQDSKLLFGTAFPDMVSQRGAPT